MPISQSSTDCIIGVYVICALLSFFFIKTRWQNSLGACYVNLRTETMLLVSITPFLNVLIIIASLIDIGDDLYHRYISPADYSYSEEIGTIDDSEEDEGNISPFPHRELP